MAKLLRLELEVEELDALDPTGLTEPAQDRIRYSLAWLGDVTAMMIVNKRMPDDEPSDADIFPEI